MGVALRRGELIAATAGHQDVVDGDVALEAALRGLEDQVVRDGGAHDGHGAQPSLSLVARGPPELYLAVSVVAEQLRCRQTYVYYLLGKNWRRIQFPKKGAAPTQSTQSSKLIY